MYKALIVTQLVRSLARSKKNKNKHTLHCIVFGVKCSIKCTQVERNSPTVQRAKGQQMEDVDLDERMLIITKTRQGTEQRI